jgi:hypothetical protein
MAHLEQHQLFFKADICTFCTPSGIVLVEDLETQQYKSGKEHKLYDICRKLGKVADEQWLLILK